MKKILVFMVFMFSLSAFGQVIVTTNPFEAQDLTPYEPVIITNPSDGNSFIDGNYIEIGVNPLTHEITTINSNINKLLRTKEVIKASIIENDLNKLVNDSTHEYIVTYIKVDNQYRPAILLKEEGVEEIQVIKTY